MTPDDVLQEFRDAGALLEGHFILTSGLHSARYLQCARAMMESARGERLCRALSEKVREAVTAPVDLVVSPAMGGVIVGHEMGRQLGVPAIFLEREEGRFTLRRGFGIPAAARCLMVEDIITTGLSSREAIAAIRAHGGEVAGAACLIDRSGGRADVGVPLACLVRMEIPVYESDALPEDLKKIPAVKPGSRPEKGGGP